MFQVHRWFLEAEVEVRTELGSKASRPGWEAACGSGDLECTGIILDHTSIFFVLWMSGVELHLGTSGIFLGCKQWVEVPSDVGFYERVIQGLTGMWKSRVE
jgi:hypothetical protein